MKQSQVNGYIIVATIYVVLIAVYGLSAILVFTIAAFFGLIIAKINDELKERKRKYGEMTALHSQQMKDIRDKLQQSDKQSEDRIG